jgi:hypothetical protein
MSCLHIIAPYSTYNIVIILYIIIILSFSRIIRSDDICVFTAGAQGRFVSHSVTFSACLMECARFASGPCTIQIDSICVVETRGVRNVTCLHSHCNRKC